MKSKAMIRMILDISMTLLLLLLMGFQFWGDAPHEWIGVGIFILFFAHQLINKGWYASFFKGKYSGMRIFMAIVNVALILCMIGMAISSVILSRYVFTFLPITGGLSIARLLHMATAYWGFVLMALHLGLHWSTILGRIYQKIGLSKNATAINAVLRIVGIAIAAYGVYAFVKRDLPTYMLIKTEFVFLDYMEPPIFFYLDYLAIMGLFVFLSHYISKAIQFTSSEKRKKAARQEKIKK